MVLNFCLLKDFFLGCTGSSLLLHGLSLVAVSRDGFSLQCVGFFIVVTSLVAEHGLGPQPPVVAAPGPTSCGTWEQSLQCMDFVVPRHVKPYQNRDQTRGRPLRCQVDFYPLHHQGSSAWRFLISFNFITCDWSVHIFCFFRLWSLFFSKNLSISSRLSILLAYSCL